VIDPVSIDEHEITLGAGETLLMYTDGVIEAGRPDNLLGEDGLLELCAAAPGLSLESFLEHIERAALTRARGALRTTSRCWDCGSRALNRALMFRQWRSGATLD